MGDRRALVVLFDYCDALDRRDAASIGALFCDDACLELTTGAVRGRDAIVATFDAVFGDAAPSQHALCPPTSVDADDHGHHLSVPFLVWAHPPGSTSQVGRGTYDVHVRAAAGRWLIQDLRVDLDGPFADVAQT